MTDASWQPIETAPRDGTILLLAGGEFHCEAREEMVRTPFTAAFVDGYWLVGGVERGYLCIEYDAPTHWMPLPAPPA